MGFGDGDCQTVERSEMIVHAISVSKDYKRVVCGTSLSGASVWDGEMHEKLITVEGGNEVWAVGVPRGHGKWCPRCTLSAYRGNPTPPSTIIRGKRTGAAQEKWHGIWRRHRRARRNTGSLLFPPYAEHSSSSLLALWLWSSNTDMARTMAHSAQDLDSRERVYSHIVDELHDGRSTRSRYSKYLNQFVSSCVPDRKHISRVGYVIESLRVE